MKFKNPFQSAAEKVISTSEENKLYEKVTVAIENNDIDKGVWTKAFTQADGDTTKQKVIYIELMVEHYKNLIIAKQELEEARAIEAQALQAEEMKRNKMTPEQRRKKAIQSNETKETIKSVVLIIFGLLALIAFFGTFGR
jgi:uncharacterized protein with ATP-grasp and redox domains